MGDGWQWLKKLSHEKSLVIVHCGNLYSLWAWGFQFSHAVRSIASWTGQNQYADYCTPDTHVILARVICGVWRTYYVDHRTFLITSTSTTTMDTSNIKPRFRKKVETNHRWKALVGNIHLSDPELRVILELPDHRGTGRDIDIDTLRKYVPMDFEGSPVSDQEAKAVLRAAVDKAFVQVMHRVSS